MFYKLRRNWPWFLNSVIPNPVSEGALSSAHE